MKIVGGIYTEVIREPGTRDVMGSALRAAVALSASGKPNEVLSICSPGELATAESVAESLGFELATETRSKSIVFEYATAVSPPWVSTAHTPTRDFRVQGSSGEVVLAYGMLEARLDVEAETLVVDPQRPGLADLDDYIRWASGARLAIVGNRSEIQGLAATDDNEAALGLVAKRYGATTVVMKEGLRGAIAIEGDTIERVPAFASSSLKPIGSGDVFSACFAYLWGEQQLPLAIALEQASKASAVWMDEGPVGVVRPSGPILADRAAVSVSDRVYLAGPFFNAGQRWLIDTVVDSMRGLGVRVFSPLHDVGRGETKEVGKADLDGLDSCESVLALLDGFDAGTLLEVGYARHAGKRVVAYLDADANPKDLVMIVATDVRVTDDLPTAVMLACTRPVLAESP